MIKYYWLVLLIIGFNSYADDVYQSVDKNGNLVISNIKTPSATKMDLPELKFMKPRVVYSSYPVKNYPNSVNPNYNYFFNSSRNKIQINEDTRHEILREELNNELAALAMQKKLLIEANRSKPLDMNKIDGLNDEIIQHNKNIELLNRSLTQ